MIQMGVSENFATGIFLSLHKSEPVIHIDHPVTSSALSCVFELPDLKSKICEGGDY